MTLGWIFFRGGITGKVKLEHSEQRAQRGAARKAAFQTLIKRRVEPFYCSPLALHLVSECRTKTSAVTLAPDQVKRPPLNKAVKTI